LVQQSIPSLNSAIKFEDIISRGKCRKTELNAHTQGHTHTSGRRPPAKIVAPSLLAVEIKFNTFLY